MRLAGDSVYPQRPGRAGAWLFILLLLGAVSASVSAGYLAEIQVKEIQGVYQIRMVMLVNAPAKYVHDVLTDYVHIYRLNPSITESEILPSTGEGAVRVRTRMKGCVSFFCKEIGRVEDVHELPSGELLAIIVPELSDFKSGSAVWMVQPRGGNSRVIYQARLEPDFAIPPLFGSYFVRKSLRKEILTSFIRLECNARVLARLDNDTVQLAIDEAGERTDTGGVHAVILAGEDPSGYTDPPAAGNDRMLADAGCSETCEMRGGVCQ